MSVRDGVPAMMVLAQGDKRLQLKVVGAW